MGLTSSTPEVIYEPLIEGYIINIYEGIGISPHATLPQIKAMYQQRSKAAHPDKQVHDSKSPSAATPMSAMMTPMPGLNNSNTDPDAAHEEQALLNKFKVTLESTHRRAFYDCVTNYRYPELSQKDRMLMYQKYRIECYHNFLDSIREEISSYNSDSSLSSSSPSLSSSSPSPRHLSHSLASIETANNSSVAHGKLIDGMQDGSSIFIVHALYGDFMRHTSRFGNGFSSPGTAIDVTWAVRQAIYNNNNTGFNTTAEFQPEGWDDFYAIDKTYKFNQGFFDPNFLIPNWDGANRLYICYMRGSDVFQGIWEDGESVVLPSIDHLLEEPVYWTDAIENYYKQIPPGVQINCADEFDENNDIDQADTVFLDLPNVSDEFMTSALQTDAVLHSKDVIPTPLIKTSILSQSSTLSQSTPNTNINNNNNTNTNTNTNNNTAPLLADSHTSTQTTPISLNSSTSTNHSFGRSFGNQMSHENDIFLTSLSWLPLHIRGKPFYSPEGIMIPSDVWDTRMKKVKAKRRRNLYVALATLFTTICAGLHWAGIINILSWTTTAVKHGQHLLGYTVKKNQHEVE